MLENIHADITRQALDGRMHPAALAAVLRANLAQDGLRGQFGHDEYHFDNNAFERTSEYMALQHNQVTAALGTARPSDAWSAFGRLLHAVQDFYAHSNYVSLWLAAHGDSTVPLPERIDPMDPRLLASPALRSGKLYYPRELLYFIPGLRRLALAILPPDSHAHMNLDSAERGQNYPYAFAAAVQRTRLEFERLIDGLTPQERALFTGVPERDSNSSALQLTFFGFRFTPHLIPSFCILFFAFESFAS